jgi:hypothetical protein
MDLANGLGGIFNGLFGNSGAPFDKASKALNPFFDRAIGAQNPFFNAGKESIPQFQQFLQMMQDPNKFINDLMGNYQESPYAKYQQDQAMRTATNMGSASGLSGSTPLTQFAQKNARDISSEDMNQWLQNVLGINTQYGEGLQRMMGMGQNAANMISQLNQNFGGAQAGLAYGKERGRQQDQRGLWGGLMDILF